MIYSFILFSTSTAILFRCMHRAEKRVTVWFGLTKDQTYFDYSFRQFKQEMKFMPHHMAIAEISWQQNKSLILSFAERSLSLTIKNQYFRHNYFVVEKDILIDKEIMNNFNYPKEFIIQQGKYPIRWNKATHDLEVIFY